MNLELHSAHQTMRTPRVSLPNRVYHLRVGTARHEPVFADHRAAHAACRRFEDIALLGDARMLAWVLMPDHVHWLLQLGVAKSLQKTVGALKVFSTLEVNVALGRGGPIWSRAYQDRMLCDEDEISAVARDILENPLHAGLAERIGDYPYWNAAWL